MMRTITKHAKFLLFTFTFLLFNLNGFAQTCSPAPVGLVSWWQAENNALDSRSRNNGTLLNGATFGAGNIGQAFNFDGVNDSVQVPHDANQNINGSFSAETWIFPRSVSNNSPRILEKSDGSNRWILSLNQTAPANALGLIINPSQVTLFSAANSIVLNQWSHVAFTYNSVNNEVKLFLWSSGTIF
jgi:Concanavalin A-like lectin/glucanases superfamily